MALKRNPLFVPVLAALATVTLALPAFAQQQDADQEEMSRLEKAVARDSSKVDNLFKLGVLYLDHDRALDATRVLTRAVVGDPKNVKALVNLGVAWDASGKPQLAQKYYEKALEIAPKDPVAKCRLASSIYAQSQYSRAVDLLRQIIDENPKAYCGYFSLGVAFADAGIYRDAIRMWKKVVELAPDSQEAVSAKESIDVLEKFVLKQQ